MTWLKYLGPAIQFIALLARALVGRRERRVGRLEADREQAARDLKAIRKAADARRAVRHDADSVRRDPRNRNAG